MAQRRPLSLQGAACTDSDLNNFQNFYNSASLAANSAIEDRRSKARVPSPMMSENLIEMLDNQPVTSPETTVQPEWLKDVGLRRSSFEYCALVVQLDGITRVFQFIFAFMGYPHYIGLSELYPVDATFPPVGVTNDGGGDWDESLLYRRHCYRMDLGDYRSAALLHGIDATNVRVVEQLEAIGGMILGTNLPIVRLDVFLQLVPVDEKKPCEKKEGQGPGGKKKSMSNAARVLKMPWARKAIDRSERLCHDGGDAPVDVDDGTLLGEDVAEEIGVDYTMTVAEFENLEAIRRRVQEAPMVAVDDFRVTGLGGNWTSKHKGESCDYIIGMCKGKATNDWCKNRNLSRSKRYPIKGFGEVDCTILARAWCHRMQYYLNKANRQDQPDQYEFTQDDHDRYIEPTEFVKLATVLSETPKGAPYVDELRSLLKQ
jgi:hypothetical protein